MILVGIDVGKNSHYFTIINKQDGEVLLEPSKFNNNLDGFNLLLRSIKSYKKDNVLIGMEDTGHYHFTLMKHLLDKHYTVALINPVTTDLTRRASGSVSKTDKLDTLTICDVLASNNRKKPYRISKVNRFDLYEQRCLTRHHHNLKEELNVYSNRLQKCIDIVFPEYNSLFTSKYGIVYNNILKTFTSAANIAKADIRSLRKCFDFKRQGKRISLTADKLKQAAKDSIGIDSISDVIQIRHLIDQIELINNQLEEIDKKIEEFSIHADSPILSIPGISHFSGTSILAEIGDINNFSNHKQIIKYAGVAPSTYESSQFKAQHTSITKKGSKYLRKTLYQIILPVINNNKVFKEYYSLKISQGKSHRCACGHCIRKLLRIIYHLLTNNITYDPSVVR
ncbi:MAG: IS110 family transposase [Erysipelotrichaceae bacterium]|nr:IS110 family transposase [Erysipelotrichaceae bacterium]